MADDDTPTTDAAADDGADTGSGDATSTGPDLATAGKKALEAERKARRDAEKRLRDLEGQLKAIGDKDKTEVERLRDELTDAMKRADAAEQRVLRMEVGADKGLSPAQARRLVGTTREELEADAAELLDAFGGSQTSTAGDTDAGGSDGQDAGVKPTAPRRPTEALRPGAAPADTSDKPDPKKIAADILRSPF